MSTPPQSVVTVRPIASPLPLGFLALAAGTLLVAAVQLGWLSATESRDVALLLLVFVAPPQGLASIMGFLARDVVAATGMGILACAWAATGTTMLTGTPGAPSDPLGLLLLVAGAALLVPAVTAAPVKAVPAAVIGLAAVRFAATGVQQLRGTETWADLAGVVGLALCALALYAAAATALEDARHRTVLPVGRRDDGRRAIDADPAAQVAAVHHEAGVRDQL